MTSLKSESKIQQEIVQWFNNNFCLAHHDPRSMILHIPNEGKNNARLIPVGLYPGAADLLIIHRGKIILVEVKDSTGKQSASQIRFEHHCIDVGIPYYLVRSLEDFQKIIFDLENN